jgi:hypothetical protein
MEIEPRFENLGPALQRGIITHEAMAAYYITKKHGGKLKDCVAAAQEVIKTWIEKIVTEMPTNVKLLETICKIQPLIEGYAEYYGDEKIKVIEVETFHTTRITEDHDYGMRLDLLIEFQDGEYRGDLAIFDTKVVYNFKTQSELDMDGQLSKYVRTLRDNGFVISKGVFDQIRYRSLKDPSPSDIYKRELVKATKTETDRIWHEQAISAREIAYYRSLPKQQFSDEAVRNLSPFTCKYCHFKTLCKSELLGEDITYNVGANYQPNTYGYADLVAVD